MTDIDNLIARQDRVRQTVEVAVALLREQQDEIVRLTKLLRPEPNPHGDLIAELRATHCSNEGLHDAAAATIEHESWQAEIEFRRAERAEAERDAAYRAGIERAAKACDELAGEFGDPQMMTLDGMTVINAMKAGSANCAAAIRALLNETAGESPAPPQP